MFNSFWNTTFVWWKYQWNCWMHFCSGGRVADQSLQRVAAAPQNICRKNIHLWLLKLEQPARNKWSLFSTHNFELTFFKITKKYLCVVAVTPFQMTGNFSFVANEKGYPPQCKLTWVATPWDRNVDDQNLHSKTPWYKYVSTFSTNRGFPKTHPLLGSTSNCSKF